MDPKWYTNPRALRKIRLAPIKKPNQMDVQVKLYGLFKKYAPEERQEFQLKLPPNSNVKKLLKILKIPFEQERTLLVNGQLAGLERRLESEDIIVIFSPMSGG